MNERTHSRPHHFHRCEQDWHLGDGDDGKVKFAIVFTRLMRIAVPEGSEEGFVDSADFNDLDIRRLKGRHRRRLSLEQDADGLEFGDLILRQHGDSDGVEFLHLQRAVGDQSEDRLPHWRDTRPHLLGEIDDREALPGLIEPAHESGSQLVVNLRRKTASGDLL
jgi:hypothetical protein